MLAYILLASVVVIGLVILLGYLRPRHVIVERHQDIAAPPEAVWPHLIDLRAFHEWSPWTGRDPEMTVDYTGPDRGVGQVMSWKSEKRGVGNGRMELIEAEDGARTRAALDFGDLGTAESWFMLTPRGTGTQVTWGLNADMGANPLGRWMGLMMDRWVGADYEAGLANLKAKVEGG